MCQAQFVTKIPKIAAFRLFLFAFPSLIAMLSCSGLKLDRESNCLNDKTACFKWDVTRPKLDTAVEPQANQIVSLLPYIDLRFSEELKEPTAADFQLLDAGASGLTITSVEKIANFTYRLNLSGGVQNGPIRVRFTNVKDYAGNVLSGIDEVQFTGNVDISVVFDFSSITNPNFHAGVSNWVTGGYRNTTIKWYHDFTNDPNNTYQVFVTTGSISCPATLASGPLAGGLANTQSQVFDRTADFTSGPGSYRIVVCVRNESQNKKGVGSVLIVRDDDPPVVSHLPLDGEYNAPQNLTISCTPNKDKIYYSQSSFPNWTGVLTDPANPADPYSNATGALTGGTEYTGPVTTPNPANPTRTKYRYGCFDIAGNWSTVSASTAPTYVVDTTLPEVSVALGAGYRGYVSTGGYTSTTLEFTTNQSGTPYRIVAGATSCAAMDGTSLIGPGPFSTPAAGTLISHTIPATSFSTASSGVNNVYICVQNAAATKWGAASLQVIRDDVRPTTVVSVSTGSYGAQQSVVVTCDNNADKIAYTTDGTTPSFFANGEIQNGFSHTGPYTTPEGVTTFKYLCRDKAGNEELAVSTQVYTIDSLLPTITVVSNSNPAISTSGSKTSTTISWRSSRGSRPFSFRTGGTNCATATQLAPAGSYSGTTSADTNTVHTTQVNAADLGADGNYSIRICVTNLVGDFGSASFTVTKDTVGPVIAALDASPSLSAIDATNFTLSWSPASDTGGSGVAMYRIFRSLNSNSYPGYPSTPDYSAPTNPATITMPDSQKYFLRIVPVDVAGNIAGGAIPYYNELSTKPSVNIVVTGNSGSLSLTDGSQTPVVVASSMAWTTNLGTGQTYNFNITSQPAGQVCAIKEKQFGTLSSDLTININCLTGQMVGGRFQAVAASGMNSMLYRTRADVWVSTFPIGGELPNSVAVAGGFVYFGTDGDCDAGAPVRYCIYKRDVNSAGSPTQLVNNIPGIVRGIATDGTNLYFTTLTDNRLYKVPITGGTPAEIASGFTNPFGIVLDGNDAYICNRGTNEILKVDLLTGTKTSVVTGVFAPLGISIVGNQLYFTLYATHAIFRVPKTGGSVVTVFGVAGTPGEIDGNTTAARFNEPHDLVYDGKDNLFVSDYSGHTVRRIRLSSGRVTTIVGDSSISSMTYSNGTGPTAKLPRPVGITTDGRNLFISLHGDRRIVKLTEQKLTGHWPLANTTEDYASDATPTAGAWVGTAAYGAGRFNEGGGAAVFDGSNHITSKDIAIAANQPFTMAAWVNVADLAASRPIIGNLSNYEFQLYIATNGSVNFQNWYSSGGLSNYLAGTSGGVIKPGTWVHVAYVFRNGSGPQPGGRIFINGHDMTVASTQASSASLDSFASSVTIGATLSAASKFKGSLADVRIYNRLLTDAEINELAQDASSGLVGSSYNTGATELISYFPIDSLTGNDYGPAGLNLSNSSASPVNGIDGDYPGAVDLQGTTGSNLNVGSAAGLPRIDAPRSFCAFVRPTAQPAAGMRYPIISYGGTSANFQGAELVYFNQSGTDYRVAMTKIGDSVDAQIKLPVYSWSHVCGTNDGAVSRIYVNGVELPATGSNAQVFASTAGVLKIGTRVYDPSNTYAFKGNIDEARIYNKALSASEIRQLSAIIPAGLIARYDFDGDTQDVSGFGNGITNSGATPTDDRYGLNSRAYKFDGSAFLTGPTVTQATTDITFAAWIQPASLGSAYVGIVGNYNGTDGVGGSGGGIFLTPANQLLFISKTGVGAPNPNNDCSTTYTPPTGVYTHVAVTQSSSGPTSRVYVNGSLIRTCTPSAAVSFFNGGNPFKVGEVVFPTRFNGNIDDVRIYNHALPQSAIQALVQQPNRRIFVTANTYTGNLGGISGADAKCNNVADGNKPPGVYKAMLVDAASSGLRRACTSANCATSGVAEGKDWVLVPNLTYVRADNTPVFTANFNGVYNFPGQTFYAPISTSAFDVWTGINFGVGGEWTVDGGPGQCSFGGGAGWMNSLLGGSNGVFGNANAISQSVSATPVGIFYNGFETLSCLTARRLYCVEQ